MVTLTYSSKLYGPSRLIFVMLLVFMNRIISVVPSENTIFAMHGETIELHCAGFASDKCPYWLQLKPYARIHSDGDIEICDCDTEYTQGFHCDNSSSGNFILRIKDAGANHAGKFRCKDSFFSFGKILTSTQIIVTSLLSCSSNVELSQVIGPNECSNGQQPDRLILSCSATFDGAQNYQKSLILWKKTGEEGTLVSNCTNVSNTIRCTLVMNATLDMNGKSFICSTNDNRHSCHLGPIKVLYAVNGSSTPYKKQVKVGETVTCEANTNSHQCTYKWWRYTKHKDGDEDKVMMSNISRLTITRPGSYRCEAKCPFRNNTCRVFPTVINVFEPTIANRVNALGATAVNQTVAPVGSWQNTPARLIGPSSSNVVKVGWILAFLSTFSTAETLIQ